MSNSPESGKKVSNKPKRANGRGSIYQITKPNGRKVWKAAIKDINGKLRTKNFTKMSKAEISSLLSRTAKGPIGTKVERYKKPEKAAILEHFHPHEDGVAD